jgi:subfamily B ATP-binding cassette protein MsbA
VNTAKPPPGAPFPPPADWRVTLQLLKRFLPFARPYRRAILWASLLMVLRVSTDIVQPWPLKVVLDNVLRNRALRLPLLPDLGRQLAALGPGTLLLLCVAFMVARTVLDAILTYWGSRWMTAISQRVIYDVRCAVFSHVQRLSLTFFDRQRSGDLVTRFTSDSANIEDMLVGVVGVALVNGLTIAATLTVMFWLSWKLTLVALTVLPALYATNRYFTTRIRAAARDRRRKEGEIASLVQEDLSLVRVIQAFGREPHEAARFAAQALAARAAGLRSVLLQSQYNAVGTFVTGLGTTLIVLVGAQSVLRYEGLRAGGLPTQGGFSLGTLIVLLTYLRSLYNPVKQLSKMVNVVTKATVSAERVAEVLDTLPEVTDAPDARDAPPLLGHVQLDNVCFAYRSRDGVPGPSVLRGVSLDIPAGTTVALVGHTGSGKSTLVHLLPRFFDPTDGRVLLDGHDLRHLTLASVRRQISVLPQEAVLFRATVWENIAFGSDAFPPGFSLGGVLPEPALMERIRAAAMAANAHEFIVRLPEGYQTVVGERGGTLSGGQRQRIAIARAMIRAAPLLVLDEPTTGLDAESEDHVLEALDRLRSGRTTVIIAHRLSTIRSAHRIVVLENGVVAESGTHCELIARGGRYHDFYKRQSGTGAGDRPGQANLEIM